MSTRTRHALWFVLALAAWQAVAADALTGTVVDARSGAPVHGATVVVLDTSAASSLTSADGTFVIRAPVQGAITIGARAAGYGRALAEARGGNPLRVALTPLRPKAVYLSVFGISSSALRDAALALPQSSAINALVIDVKGDRGMTPYRSAARDAIGASGRVEAPAPMVHDFPALLAALHGRNLYLIARIVVFKDEPLAAAHPEWAVRDGRGDVWRDREGLRWIDPFSGDAREHNLDLAEEAARMGFDEIQFDYLRFPDAGGLRFAQTSTREARVAAITGFLRAARTRLARYNVYISADIFGYVCWNLDDTAIGQQLEPLGAALDYISPMLYPSGFTWGLPGCNKPVEHPGEIVARSLAEAKRRTGLPGVRFRPWLQAFRDYAFDHREFDADEIRAQTQAADSADTDGWMLWNPRNQYDSTQLPR
ncbi:putative glycoside hydrolase [Cupriavidus basilensis]|uniref:Putative glycoside hydrolase n=1 Tax=Cupriavidus basilensis TaxID=68895 RepID=A0A0C4YC48_9BURK|nr:putative glycoside hydrolase [Cupriavidus basilensis]AJG19739.1 putative glycoside hydrolase [Cupriavidus basilensis]